MNFVAAYLRSSPPNKSLLERGHELPGMLKEDSEKPAAADVHELLRARENTHRMWIAESHRRHVLFREESRWPAIYFRTGTGAKICAVLHIFFLHS
jgi:succinate dehydrogenase/fumarate reductase flavoprotein subunit